MYASLQQEVAWSEPQFAWPARSPRVLSLALGLTVLVALADVLTPLVSVSILYTLPLLLIARAGYASLLWRATLALTALTFGIYFLKYTLHPPASGAQYFDYRLVNRSFLALAICLLGKVGEMWLLTERDRHDPQLPPDFVREEDEVNRTLAVACSVPLVLIIALGDFLTPAHINLAVLYPVPLFLLGWVRRRRWLWSMVGLVVALSILGYTVCPHVVSSDRLSAALWNRLLAVGGVVCVTGVLQSWIRSTVAGTR